MWLAKVTVRSFWAFTCNILPLFMSLKCSNVSLLCLNELPLWKKDERSSNISIIAGLNCDDFNCIDCVLTCLVLVLSWCDSGVSISKLVDKVINARVRLKGRRSITKQTWKMVQKQLLIGEICCVSVQNARNVVNTD